MTATEVLELVRQLPREEKLQVLEALAHTLRTDLEAPPPAPCGTDLAAAAAALREEYLANPELTAFTVLDGEELQEAR
jgi:hypothetical protein